MSYNTALIVDDSKLARIALKKKLEQRGLQIVMAEDAKQALGVLEDTPIDIVFMDHLMPEMDGFEATRQIKANDATAHLPVIMCSGKEKQGYLEEARAIGASNVLPKPAESEAIEAVFAELELQAPAPVAAMESAPAPAETTAEPALDEAEIRQMLQPLSEQLKALAIRLDEQAEEIEQRSAAAADSLRSMESRLQDQPAVDVPALRAEILAEVDQRLAALEAADAAAILAEVDQRLASLETADGAAIQSELDTQWEAKLSAAITAALAGVDSKIAAVSAAPAPAMDEWVGEVEQRVSRSLDASVVQLVEDRGAQLEARVQQHIEQQQAQQEPVAPQPEWDGEAIRQSLKEELLEELAAAPRPPIDNDEIEFQIDLPNIKAWQWMTAVSSLMAVAAVALHWL